jgi:hypothetical protein
MLKTAFLNVLKREWSVIAAVVVFSEIAHYWHAHDISLLSLGVISGVACFVLMLARLPAELHKLNQDRA